MKPDIQLQHVSKTYYRYCLYYKCFDPFAIYFVKNNSGPYQCIIRNPIEQDPIWWLPTYELEEPAASFVNSPFFELDIRKKIAELESYPKQTWVSINL